MIFQKISKKSQKKYGKNGMRKEIDIGASPFVVYLRIESAFWPEVRRGEEMDRDGVHPQ